MPGTLPEPAFKLVVPTIKSDYTTVDVESIWGEFGGMGKGWLSNSKKSRKPSVERRRADRLATNTLTCKFGDVVDISTTGMRIRCERKPPIKVGQYIEAKLESNSHRLPVSGLVIWVRRKGFKGYEVGIKFVNIKRSLQAAIESLGMFGFIDLEAAAAAKEKKYGPTKTKKRIRASINLPDYYSILGLDSDATGGEIKNAFRTLARRYHPDVAKRKDDSQKFLEISQAYDVLRDSESRKSYDMRSAG